MNSATETKHDNNAEEESGDKRRGMKLVSRNEGHRTRPALRIGISEDLFSTPSNPIHRFLSSNNLVVQDEAQVLDASLGQQERPRAAIYIALATGLVFGFLIGRRL